MKNFASNQQFAPNTINTRGCYIHIGYKQLPTFTGFSNLFFDIHIFFNIRAEAHYLKWTDCACASIILKVRKLIEKYEK